MSFDLHALVQGQNTTVETATFQDKGTYTYTENANTNTKLVEVDRDNDGKVDSMSLFYKDDKGNVVKGAYDNDGDGLADKYSLFYYNDEGKMTTRYDDIDGDNEFDSYVEFSYDEDGALVESEPKELTGWLKNAIRHKSNTLDKMVIEKQSIEISESFNSRISPSSIAKELNNSTDLAASLNKFKNTIKGMDISELGEALKKLSKDDDVRQEYARKIEEVKELIKQQIELSYDN